MSDPWQERLSEYLDGELPPSERTRLEAHLLECAACVSTLAELKLVVARAGALNDAPPPEDIWPGIAARIGGLQQIAGAIRPGGSSAARGRRFSFSLPQLAAASIALMLVSGGAVWVAQRGSALRSEAPIQATSSTSPGAASFEARLASDESFTPREYDQAIADLEAALAQGRGRLAPATLRALDENLRIIDRAIADARRALTADPGNAYLSGHLAETMWRKVELLRRANVITTARI